MEPRGHGSSPPRNGSIEVKSDPPGAAIFLNGRNMRERTPHVFNDLTPGSYTIRLTLDGRVPWGPETVSVAAGQTKSVNVTLRAITTTLSIHDLTVKEGDSGATAAVFAVTMSAVSGQQVTADYETASGTATAGVDYQAKSGTLTFAPGDTRKTITVLVQGDTVEEADETFTVTLRNPSHATLADATATGTIEDDDDSPSLSIADARLTEGDSGSVNMEFTVMLDAASRQQVTVDYETANGTATAGVDYQAKSGTLTFAPGDTRKTITVLVQGDTVEEGNETFTVTLRNPSHATLADATATGTIEDDDGPALSIADTRVTEGDSGSVNMEFTVTLDVASRQQVTVDYETANGTATAGVDYRAQRGALTFAPGDTRKTIKVTVRGDTTLEPDETLTVTLRNPSYGTLADATATGTISNDDESFDLAVTSVQVIADALQRPGDTIRLDTTIANNGARTAPATTLRYYRSADAMISRADTEIGQTRIDSISPGETIELRLDVTLPRSAGRYYIGVCIQDGIADADGSNDCLGDRESLVADRDDDTRQTAQRLTMRSEPSPAKSLFWETTQYLSPGETDYFRIVYAGAHGRGRLSVQTKGTTDTKGAILYASGDPYLDGTDDDSGRGSNFLITTRDDIIGDYFIVVTGATDVDEGNYVLRVVFEKFDHADGTDGARDVQVGSSQVGYTHQDDDDWFRITTSGCGTLKITIADIPQFGDLPIPDIDTYMYDQDLRRVTHFVIRNFGSDSVSLLRSTNHVFYILVTHSLWRRYGPYALYADFASADC